MPLTLFLFTASAIAIYFACEYFVNGIEWVGFRLKLGATAVGTVLAAFGTALPESAVTFMAVVFGETAEQKDIGVGAALGGPLVLATVAYAVVGIVLWSQRAKRPLAVINADQKRLAFDQLCFMGIFIFKLGLGVLVFSWKPWLGLAFLLVYAMYVKRELCMREDAAAPADLDALKIRPRLAEPGMGWALLQTVAALAVIAYASHVFVRQIESIGHWMGIAPHLAALLLAPVATELPEIMNAVIWARQGKERLALANISGSMMIQATIPSAMAISLTPWQLDAPLLMAGGFTLFSIFLLWLRFRRSAMRAGALAGVSGFYILFGLFVGWRFTL